MSSKELDFFDLETTLDYEFDDRDLRLGYTKKELVNHKSIWIVYNGRGELVGHASCRQTALVIMKQNDMVPYSIH